jgi:hypothetical protein
MENYADVLQKTVCQRLLWLASVQDGEGFNVSRFDRWAAMLFGYIGVVNLIDCCSRERTGEQRSMDRLRQTKSDEVAE